MCCLQATHFRSKEHRLKVKGWKKIFRANGNLKKAGVAVFISGTINFRTKALIRDKKKKRAFHSDKELEPAKEITLVNIYTPSMGAPEHISKS